MASIGGSNPLDLGSIPKCRCQRSSQTLLKPPFKTPLGYSDSRGVFLFDFFKNFCYNINIRRNVIMGYILTAIFSAWFGFGIHCLLCMAKRGDEQGKKLLTKTEQEIEGEG